MISIWLMHVLNWQKVLLPLIQRLFPKGIKVAVEEKVVNIDIHIIIQYGVNINAICNSIINNVKYQVNHMTGLEVGDVNVYVEGFRVQE